jgi:uncharacterized membrane protein YedE/YeeE
MRILAAVVAGLLFGAGLTVSQMVDPRKVLDFLDVGGIAKGTWDPTLMMVFVGALPVMFAGYALQRRMRRPLAGPAFLVPRPGAVDARLLIGSTLFGVGWGLAGVCPGPAVTSLALAGGQIVSVLLFVAAMVAGIMLSWLVAPSAGSTSPPATEPRT